jgi:hypothetical protein
MVVSSAMADGSSDGALERGFVDVALGAGPSVARRWNGMTMVIAIDMM